MSSTWDDPSDRELLNWLKSRLGNIEHELNELSQIVSEMCTALQTLEKEQKKKK